MTKYINEETLRKLMYEEAFEKDSDMQKWDSGCWIRYKLFENCLEAVPAEDVAPVRHGRWIDERWEGLSSFSAECSLCSKRTLAYFHYYYCPNCGAKMDGGQDDG